MILFHIVFEVVLYNMFPSLSLQMYMPQEDKQLSYHPPNVSLQEVILHLALSVPLGNWT